MRTYHKLILSLTVLIAVIIFKLFNCILLGMINYESAFNINLSKYDGICVYNNKYIYNTCLSGKTLLACSKNNKRILVVLSKKFNNTEISNLVDVFNIKNKVIISTQGIQKLMSIIAKCNKVDVNTLNVFFSVKKGKINKIWLL